MGSVLERKRFDRHTLEKHKKSKTITFISLSPPKKSLFLDEIILIEKDEGGGRRMMKCTSYLFLKLDHLILSSPPPLLINLSIVGFLFFIIIMCESMTSFLRISNTSIFLIYMFFFLNFNKRVSLIR